MSVDFLRNIRFISWNKFQVVLVVIHSKKCLETTHKRKFSSIYFPHNASVVNATLLIVFRRLCDKRNYFAKSEASR